MKRSSMLVHTAKLLVLMIMIFAGSLILRAQTNDSKKTTTPPPPPAQKSAAAKPAPANTVHPPPTSTTTAGKTTTPNKTAAGTATTPTSSGSASRGATGTNAKVSDVGGGVATSPRPAGRATAAVKTENLTSGGTRTHLPNGTVVEHDKGGHISKLTTSHGALAKMDSNGRVRTIQDHDMAINRGFHGERRIVTERPDHSRLVSIGRNRGFVEHRFERGGHEYIRRTYVYGGRTYVNVYRGYPYHGVVYYHYVPAYYYRPAFYSWGYIPWGAPVAYTGWGWYGTPWYGWSGYYFAPYPVYPSAAFWLTDYLIAENLKAAYEAQAAANATARQVQAGSQQQEQTSNNSVVLSPLVKEQIAKEVQAQLEAEQAAAQNASSTAATPSAPQQPASDNQLPPALDPNLQFFIVTTSLDVTVKGQACSLSAGDVLTRIDDTPDSDNTVEVKVSSSQKSDCATGARPRIQVADLQEMHNHFHEQLDNGLKTLADNQGKNGIPAGPAANPKAVPEGTAVPDLTAEGDLRKQQQNADQTEKEVQQASSSGSAGGND
jgi:hypothetical protein